jgi:serralysin
VASAGVTPFAVSSNPLTAIDWGTKLSTLVVDVYFAPAGTYIDGVGDFGPAQGFTFYERQQILSVLDQIAAVTNLTFRETMMQAGAEFRLGAFQLDAYEAIAFMIPPGEPYAGFMGVDPDYLRWLDGDSGNPLLSRGGFMYAVLLEELGHGLGMAHPHDEGGTSTILEGVTAPVGSYGVGDLNQGVYTMMGYTEGWPGGPYGQEYYDGTYIYVNDFGYEATPMALDVAVLQSKYGANLARGIGNDVYDLPMTNSLGTFFTCIWDAAGTDIVRYGGVQDAIIDLRPATLLGEAGGGGYISNAAGIRGGFTIAAGVEIENATGGWGSDRITGNAAANVLVGNGGDDWLLGGAGDDSLDGGDGGDLLFGDLASPEEIASFEGLLDRIALYTQADEFAF